MNRFVLGLVFGGSVYAIAWAATAPVWLALVIAALVAVLVWFGETALDLLDDFIDFLF